MIKIGTKIIEQGSTAGGVAKVQYLDESGNVLYEVNDSDKIFKMVNSKVSGLAGTGNRMVVADSSGNLSAESYHLNLTTGNNVLIKIVKNISLANNTFSDLFNFYSSGGFSSANYIGGVTGELKIKITGLNSSYMMIDSYRTFLISAKQQASGNIIITNITAKDTLDEGVIPTITVQSKNGNTNVSAKIEMSATFSGFLECNIIAEIECLSTSNLSSNLIKIN